MLLIVDNSNGQRAIMLPRLIRAVHQASQRTVILVNNARGIRRAFAQYPLRGVILSGGPVRLSSKTQICEYNRNMLAYVLACERRLPVLGICFGFQVICAMQGSCLKPVGHELIRGWHSVLTRASPLFRGLPRRFEVFEYHGDCIREAPPGFHVIARSECGGVEAVQRAGRDWLVFGVQFHPEGSGVTGGKILENFIRETV